MNRSILRARSLARRTGLIRLLHRVLPARNEDRFRAALDAAIRPADTVWDVGANIGDYTEIFVERVGPQGQVLAFEPEPSVCQTIRSRIGSSDTLVVENVALSDFDGEGRLAIEADSFNNHIDLSGDASARDAKTIPLAICRADSVAARTGAYPDVVKIDVEGFEEEVLGGFGTLLASPKLRGVFIEVHFSKLQDRGRADAPLRIEKLLRGNGLRTKWVDASHIVGLRTAD